jgi:hypothetical protein
MLAHATPKVTLQTVESCGKLRTIFPAFHTGTVGEPRHSREYP